MPKRVKKDSDDDHSDSDKPKHKKKMKKTTKGKKKPVKGKNKKPRKIKIINPNLQTTAPPQPRPITHNQPMVSGHFDKNDAKEIEKIKDSINKGAAVILDIKEEIKEEKRARGRPKGSKNKIIEKVEEKDVIIIPPTSSIKTRAQRKAKEPKTPTVAPYKLKSAIKPKSEKISKPVKSVITKTKIKEMLKKKQLDALLIEYEIDDKNVKRYLSNQQKLADYLYEVINNPEKPPNEVPLFVKNPNPYESGLNDSVSKSNKPNVSFGLSPIKFQSVINSNENDRSFNDTLQSFDVDAIDRLLDQSNSMINQGLNVSSGGSLDDSYQEDSNLLSNLMDKKPF